MPASQILRRSINHLHSFGFHKTLLEPFSLASVSNPQQWSYHPHRTLILEPSSSQFVNVHRLSHSDSGIVEVSLNRPETKNAIGKDLLSGFQSAIEDVRNDSSARVMLLRSLVPKAFCSGADLKERRTQTPDEIQSFVTTLRSTFSVLEGLRIPTIAVIEGAALGGGLEMALSCDLRICGEDAVLGLPETALAIIPGAGGTQRLSRIVGKAKAMELIFTGRRISGATAMSIGLVNQCVPAGEAHRKALEIAREINEKGPVAIRMAKMAIKEGLEVNIVSGMEVEQQCYVKLFDTQDRLEGLAAFSEKRKPKYNGK